MNASSSESNQGDGQHHAWVQQTRLVREWKEIKEHVIAHKWYESERAGRDIGWDRAMVDWMVKHGSSRRRTS